jgi:hypothetical protein
LLVVSLASCASKFSSFSGLPGVPAKQGDYICYTKTDTDSNWILSYRWGTVKQDVICSQVKTGVIDTVENKL